MRIGLKILLSDIVPPSDDITWGDIIDNWEAYALEWQASNALGVTQTEAPLLDMFNDEGVTIKRQVKDLSDPKKLFTDFSRGFTVPATKKNNMIFQHYYNIEIQDGLDTRELLPCRLLLNNTTYQVGLLNIEGVNMRDGVPTSYKVRFIGKLAELARRVGQDELSALDLSSLNIDNFNPKGEFQAPAANDIVFPLCSRSKRFLFNGATPSLNVEESKNIAAAGVTPYDDYGISERDLVGALRVGKILDIIALKYGISFSGVFTRNYIRDLYLWMHKASKDKENDLYSAAATNLTPQTPPANSNGYVTINSSSVDITGLYANYNYAIQVSGTWTGAGKAILKKDGQAVAEVTTSGNRSNAIWVTSIGAGYPNIGTGNFTAELETLTSNTGATLSIILGEYEYTIPQGEIRPEMVLDAEYTYTETGIATGLGGSYIVNENLPKMKVMDFLSSLFKMFNIIAEVDENNNINTRHFDAFMSEGEVYDVTQYIDQSEYSVDKPNLYSSIYFGFSKPKTTMELAYKQVNASEYGSLSYQLTGAGGYRLSGDEYKIELKNQRIPVERLYSLGASPQTPVDLVYTNFSDLKGAEQDIDPAFTYIASMYNHINLAWTDGLTVDPTIDSYALPVNLYNGNAYPNSVLEGQVGLYFGEELNEAASNTSVVGFGLFNNFYKGLTSMIFDENTRKVKFSSELPQRIILKLKLSDVLYISGKFYQINSIETNYMTGKSMLDLTLTGRSKLPFFVKNTYNVQNTGGGSLRVTFVNWNGYIAATTIGSGATVPISCVGEISTFSNDNYSVTLT